MWYNMDKRVSQEAVYNGWKAWVGANAWQTKKWHF